MGLLKLLLLLFQALFLFDEVFGIVPFAGGEASIDDSLRMLELIHCLGSTSVKESGFEGLDLGFQLSELLAECHHLVNDIAGRRGRRRIHDAPRSFVATMIRVRLISGLRLAIQESTERDRPGVNAGERSIGTAALAGV